MTDAVLQVGSPVCKFGFQEGDQDTVYLFGANFVGRKADEAVLRNLRTGAEWVEDHEAFRGSVEEALADFVDALFCDYADTMMGGDGSVVKTPLQIAAYIVAAGSIAENDTGKSVGQMAEEAARRDGHG
jgi:hypothetical protein